MKQKEFVINDSYDVLDAVFAPSKKVFLVCDGAYPYLRIGEYFDSLPEKGTDIVCFSDIKPNPDYSSVKEAVGIFKEAGCDMIIAVGGGSAMDVAKCVKLYANMDDSAEYLFQPIVPNDIPLIAVPTTAGTGSEATRYAVIYYQGEKQSITHESCIPSVVIFDPASLSTLPEYQRKATMMDALCHSVESFWSVNSTEESRAYSTQAIGMILDSMDAYLNNEDDGNARMLKAADIAGKAINITQTTAGHAMCYKLTGLYGIAHGHAAGLCVSALMPYMIGHTDDCIDSRGKDYLDRMFTELASAMRCASPEEMCGKFSDILSRLELRAPSCVKKDLEILKNSVNPTRLANHPIRLSIETIEKLYREILKL